MRLRHKADWTGVRVDLGTVKDSLARGRNLGRHFGVSALMCRTYNVF
jgi:hypothetical protein